MVNSPAPGVRAAPRRRVVVVEQEAGAAVVAGLRRPAAVRTDAEGPALRVAAVELVPRRERQHGRH